MQFDSCITRAPPPLIAPSCLHAMFTCLNTMFTQHTPPRLQIHMAPGTSGVTITGADAKTGDVDVKMHKGMDEYFERQRRTVMQCGGDLQVVAQTRLIVILSGDHDFSRPLQKAHDLGFRTMIVHFGKLSCGYTTHAEFVWGGWQHVRDKASTKGRRVITNAAHTNHPAPSSSSRRGSSPHADRAPRARQWHLSIPNDHKKVPMIIGKGGENVKKLQDKHTVKLDTGQKGVLCDSLPTRVHCTALRKQSAHFIGRSVWAHTTT
jgi:hypothetical protein